MWYRCSHFRKVSGGTPVRCASAAMLRPADIVSWRMHNYAAGMPEGDAIHRAARRLQVLAGQRIEVETPYARAATKGLVGRLYGRLLDPVEGVCKNGRVRFQGGLQVRR